MYTFFVFLIGNKGYDFFEKDKDKDKDNILVDNILDILFEDIFRQLILQRIRKKGYLKIFVAFLIRFFGYV